MPVPLKSPLNARSTGLLRALFERHQGGIPRGDFWPLNFSPWIDGKELKGISMQTVTGLVRRGLLEESRIGYRLTDIGIEVGQELSAANDN